MKKYHVQLQDHMKKVAERESGLLVAGFVVVMYENGTKYHIQRTTYNK